MTSSAGAAVLFGLACIVALQQRIRNRRQHSTTPNRYASQKLILGIDGEDALRGAAVLVIGCGGLGSGCIPLLAGSGLSRLGLVDFDIVEESNLHRQTIHRERDIGTLKVESAKRFVHELNSNVRVDVFALKIESFETLAEMITSTLGFDLVVDCTDNLATRYLVNAGCVKARVPLVSAAAVGTFGQLAVYWPSKFPLAGCYECAFPRQMNDGKCEGSCNTDGVLGPVPTVIGALQALEAIKLLSSSCGKRRVGDTKQFKVGERLVCFELDTLDRDSVSALKLKRRANCPACANMDVTANMEQTREGEEVMRIEEDDFVIDVRPQGDVPFARANYRIPLNELRYVNSKLDIPATTTRRIVCVCRSGISSRIAARILLFRYPTLAQVCTLQGGISHLF